MKINKLFHWLYFIVMMLPILAIPIFAIYSHRHTIDTYSVTRTESVLHSFDFSQYVVNGLPSGYDNWDTDNTFRDDIYLMDNSMAFDGSDLDAYIDSPIALHDGDKLYFSCYYQATDDITFTLSLDVSSDEILFYNEDVAQGNPNFLLLNTIVPYHGVDKTFDHLYLYLTLNDVTRFKEIQLFNLTTIFGTGNEPTLDDCASIFSTVYHEHGVVYNYSYFTYVDVTYNDTDIGSQFTYQVYNVVDKYFNYDKVFNFGDLYSWLNLTFFNGGAPLGFFIFWHLLIYWLLTSILWLVFDVLMYVPQLVHRWLDKASLS